MRLTLVASALACGGSALASSHAEAPFITEMRKVDNTDVYAFRSYEANRAGNPAGNGQDGFVTLISNFFPLQDPYGGPNFFFLDPDALYEIHVDNNGDAKEDLTFRFRFTNDLRNITRSIGGKDVAIALRNFDPITGADPTTSNIRESYRVNVVRGNRRSGQRAAVTNAADQADTFIKPLDNIGQKSIPDYAAYASQFIYNITIPGCTGQGRVFVGQRKEGFQVNLGEVFDLINLTAAQVTDPNGRDARGSATADKNVTSIALEIPTACLTQNATQPIIGVWSTASVRQGRLINRNPGSDITSATREGGAWAQVSRLGAPLINEVVIGLKDKDRFNSSRPEDDAQSPFAEYLTNPTLPALVEEQFTSAGVRAPQVFPRADLVAVFLTGVPGVNQVQGGSTAEILRLNTAVPATLTGQQNDLGAALCFVNGAPKLDNPGCDPAGFPNGRRPGDDVTDIELRVLMGFLLPDASKPSTGSANLAYTDGALVTESQFDATFPYLRTPIPGSPNDANGVLGQSGSTP
ncbi:MAG: DUF4331 domain-containing protein [Burkholderiales bacterium]